jgi:hypothetical protein
VYHRRVGSEVATSQITQKYVVQRFLEIRKTVAWSNSLQFSDTSNTLLNLRSELLAKSTHWHLSQFVRNNHDSQLIRQSFDLVRETVALLSPEVLDALEHKAAIVFDLIRIGKYDHAAEICRLNSVHKSSLRFVRTVNDVRLLRRVADGLRVSLHQPRAAPKKFTLRFSPRGIVQPIKNAKSLWMRKKNLFFQISRAKIERIKFKLAALASPLAAKFYTEAWLVGERRGQTVQDCGYSFFKWCHHHLPNRNIFFVTSAKNQDAVRSFSSRVLVFGSFKHLLLLQVADGLIFDCSLADLCPDALIKDLSLSRQNSPALVFLGHGIIANSRMGNFYNAESMLDRYQLPDIFCVSSEKEKAFVTNNLRHAPDKVIVTGLTRYDYLDSKTRSAPSKHRRRVLYIPTWRRWLESAPRDVFRASTFYQRIRELMLSEKIATHNLNLTLILHHKIGVYNELFEELRTLRTDIRLMSKCDLREELQNADAVITDYSSIFADALLLRKPIVLYRFDSDDFWSATGRGWLDLEVELPQSVCNEPDDVFDRLSSILSDCLPSQDENRLLESLIPFRDGKNCARVAAALDSKLSAFDRFTANQ